MSENKELVIPTEIENSVESLEKYSTDIKVDSLESATYAGSQLSKLSELKKTVEDQRKEITKPINDSLKSINSFFRKFSAPIKQIDSTIRAAVLEYGKDLEDKSFETVRLKAKQVISVADEALVPKEYLMVNLSKVKADIKAGKEIPGIEVKENYIVSL